MATGGRWMSTTSWLLRLVAAAALCWQLANSEPQLNLLNKGCSQYDPTNVTDYSNNLNATFSDLRTQISGGSRRFATAQREGSSDQVYGMFQCRNYMSETDCLACYDFAASQIRNCTFNGARVVYDGCFLRYESYNFYEQTVQNTQICSDRSVLQATKFVAEATTFLEDLKQATPMINGYFAASISEVPNTINSRIYGMAQCSLTVSRSGCQGCLNSAYESIQGCFPNADGRIVDVACFFRYSDTPFFADNQTVNIKTFLDGGKSSNNTAIIGGVLGGAALILIFMALTIWYIYSRKLKTAQIGDILGATELQRPNKFSYEDLKAATNNFSEQNKLGQGSFGAVYKANLKNGTIVAVKKLDISYSTAKADYESEVRLISNAHHRNLVRLLGCCSKRSQLLLVYEYMENGSLDRFLYGDRRGSLTWKQRFDIIFGTARGIAYLHEHYHVTIIHRDIKPSNILLDQEFQAKIADFGLVRLLPESQSHVSTKFAGTLGYTSPEYAIHGHLSERVDTYSLGVVILEIISGRRCSDMNIDSDTPYLLEEARKMYEDGKHQELADEAMDSNEYNPEDLKKVVEIALLCTQSLPTSRPTISEILAMLISDHPGKERAPIMDYFRFGDSVVGETRPTSIVSSASNATASISHFTGR